MKYPVTPTKGNTMSIENLLLFLAILVFAVLLIWDMTRDPRIMDAPTKDEMTTVIPDPFAPREPKHRDDMRAVDQPYIAKRFYGPDNYGPRTRAKVEAQAQAFEILYGVEAAR